jgi:hypothetical protein
MEWDIASVRWFRFYTLYSDQVAHKSRQGVMHDG